ncbi:FAD-binding dehydrogenase [Candidatus Marsarchaeota G1 archaeon BE_D]|jgi:precorrin 3B synthase CobZ|uniref:FAD-binding dehydrogenase n=1 Tax=Candidatus Marsarchaeota G1 archaeon BE_D TaxID=1978156 RepID=A0A2R6AIE2_9ARCH|nr:MAG: FAD-binding dehydrogenase [Candidatus Marsarchaeota G1 archaeon BE_D]
MKSVQTLVIGGGNAALTAAITCAESGLKTLILEAAPVYERGGNTKYTRDIRYMHSQDKFTSGEYTKKEFLADLRSVSGNKLDEHMAETVIEDSENIPRWMENHGVKFKKGEIKGTLSLARTNAFFLGGGKALINSYHEFAKKIGIKILYNAEVQDLRFKEKRCEHIVVRLGTERIQVSADWVIIASGGFEANLEKLREYWGDIINNFIIRGTKHNKGFPLFSMIKNGAKTIGSPYEGHMVAVDARAPKFDGGIVTRIDAIPMGIVINKNGKRFYDEGEDLWPKRYAIWGRLIAEQPDQIAYVIIDSKMLTDFLPTAYPPYFSNDLKDLFRQLNLPVDSCIETVKKFNDSVVIGKFNKTTLDECHTEGLNPPKSHWARKIDTPPFYAYPLRPGLTFTYMGLKVNHEGQVLSSDGEFENVLAAGEVMSGNVLTKGYLGGFGLTIGTVFGMRAGRFVSNKK